MYDLTENILKMRPEDVPLRFYEEVKTTILDTLSVTLAAKSATEVRQTVRLYSTCTPGPSLIWWDKKTGSIVDTAYINAFTAHYLDYDSIHYNSFGHPGVVILPALFSLFDECPHERLGKDLIISYLIGLEVMVILGSTFGKGLREKGFHSTSVLGCFGVVAAASYFLDLKKSEIDSALNLCGTTLSGFLSSFGSTAKPYQTANSTRAGLTAVLNARIGAHVLEKPVWLNNLKMISGVRKIHKRGFGSPWALDEVETKFKQYPSCGYFHGVIDSLIKFKNETRIKKWSNVTNIELAVPRVVAESSRYSFPESLEEAKFSLPFNVALSLEYGDVQLIHFNKNEYLKKTPLKKLMEILEIKILDDEVSVLPDGGVKGTITIQYNEGRTTQYNISSSESGVDSWNIVQQKFINCSSNILNTSQTISFLDIVANFEKTTNYIWKSRLKSMSPGRDDNEKKTL